MSNSVVIKSNKQGITVILDDKISFDELKELVKEKFTQSSSFFGSAQIALAFDKRVLSDDEQRELLEIINACTDLKILCVLDNDEAKEELLKKAKEEAILKANEEGSGNEGLFYKGTLRSGQVLEAKTSVVVLGDVNPGGRIIANGNVVVLGSLRGNVYAGASGNEDAFVVALEMKPMQIKIGDIIARSSDSTVNIRKSKLSKQAKSLEPKIAFVEDANIYIEDLTADVIEDLRIN